MCRCVRQVPRLKWAESAGFSARTKRSDYRVRGKLQRPSTGLAVTANGTLTGNGERGGLVRSARLVMWR
jgi:hypothetical protein